MIVRAKTNLMLRCILLYDHLSNKNSIFLNNVTRDRSSPAEIYGSYLAKITNTPIEKDRELGMKKVIIEGSIHIGVHNSWRYKKYYYYCTPIKLTKYDGKVIRFSLLLN